MTMALWKPLVAAVCFIVLLFVIQFQETYFLEHMNKSSAKLDEVLQSVQSNNNRSKAECNIQMNVNKSREDNCSKVACGKQEISPSDLPKRPPDEKYVFFDIGTEPGITKQKRTFIDAILIAYATKRAVILPRFKQSSGLEANVLPFSSVVDEPYLRENLKGLVEFVYREQIDGFNQLLEFSTMKMPEDCPKPLERLGDTFANIRERIIDIYRLVDCAYIDNDVSRAVYQGILRAMRAAPKVREQAEAIITKVRGYKGDGVPRPFVCLHARIEQDFNVFVQVVRFNTQAMASKMAKYNFAKRGVNIPALYVASGEVDTSFFDPFKTQFPYVIHKSMLLDKDDPLLHAQSEVDTFKALLDFEVCQAAEIFIGHTYSIWSEMIHDLIRLPLPEEEWPKRILTYVTQSDTLSPYCSSNAFESFGVGCQKDIVIQN